MRKRTIAVLLAAGLTGLTGWAVTALSSTSAAAAAGKSTLVVVSPVGVPSLDSQNFGTSTQQEVLTNVGEPMLRFKPLTTKTKQGVPIGSETQFIGGACAKFSLVGTTFHCTLGHWVSPYGHTMTSADIKFTFDYLLAAKANGIVGMSLGSMDMKNPVTVISPTKLNINLTAHNTTAEAALTFWTFDPLDSKEVLAHATASDPYGRTWLATHTAMFGPYNVSNFVANQEVDLVKNPNYKGEPALDVPPPTYSNVVYRAVPSDGTRAQLLCAGTAQFTKAINVNLYQPLKSCSHVTTYAFPYEAEPTLYFNVKQAAFSNEDLRKAIVCAVNTKQLSQSVYSGQWPAATSLITPKIPSMAGNFDICPKPNLTKAKAFLKASGYSGQNLPLWYSVGNSGQDAQENATLIQAQLSQIGVNTTLQTEPDPTKYFVGAISGQYGMFVFVWGANVPTAAWALGAWFGPTSSLNATGYGTAKTAADLATLEKTGLGSAAQKAAGIDFQKQLQQNAVVDPLIYQENDIIVNKSVCGLRSDPGDFPFWQYLHPCK